MTVLVDQARWPWRGRLWAHLVSDESYDELHELAQAIGKRRLGFQGDHYDVDGADRERAISLGATPVDGRELVRRIREAGLRRSGVKPRWEELAASQSGEPLDALTAALERLRDEGAARLAGAMLALDEMLTAPEVRLYGDHVELVMLVDARADLELSVSEAVRSAVDSVWLSAPRVEGDRSLELFVRR